MAKKKQSDNRKPFQPQPGRPVPTMMWWGYGIIAALFIGWMMMSGSPAPIESNWGKVRSMIMQGDVQRVDVVNGKTAEVYLKPNAVAKYLRFDDYKNMPPHGQGPQLVFNVGDLATFQADFSKAAEEAGQNLSPTFVERKNLFFEMMGWLPILLLFGVFFFMMRNMSRGGGSGGQGGIFNVGKARAQVFDKNSQVNISFKDVAGLEEAKVEVMEIVDFLKRPQKYKDLGGKIPKGALLVGPPGTGKTLLAKAVAGEANVPFFSISGSDFVEMFVGVGASRVRDLFRQAKEKAPCIVFIDEIDAIGRARGKNVGFSSNDERENTLNQLLTEMDGFGTNSGVIILAATNRADILDKALMRAGRFDRQINVELPDVKEREAIFNVHLRGLKLAPQLDRTFLSRQTPGFSGADIANVCNEAALIAARNNKPAVDKEDFLAAIDRIIGGLERKNTIITPEEKRTIAFHEAGHATVSWLREHANPLIKVTIIPRGKALGAAWYLPEERQITTREQLMDELAATLGGRVSEEMVFGKISTGALSDLEKATKQAYAMVSYFGMSDKVGNVSFYDSSGQNEMSLSKPYSEQTAQNIDAEARAIIDEGYAMARETLAAHREGLERLAAMLLEKEVIFTEDLENLFGKRKKDIEKEEAEKALKAAGNAEPAPEEKPAKPRRRKKAAAEEPTADGAQKEGEGGRNAAGNGNSAE